jgi:hypothetical protein
MDSTARLDRSELGPEILPDASVCLGRLLTAFGFCLSSALHAAVLRVTVSPIVIINLRAIFTLSEIRPLLCLRVVSRIESVAFWIAAQ